MIKTIEQLLYEYKNYKDPYNKIKRLCNEEKLFKINRGLYEDNKHVEPYLLASAIYGPSYISFEYALSYHNMIPERVNTITCATNSKGKKKEYSNFYGYYSYRDIPQKAFSKEVLYIEENGYSYFIASKEKALCDKLYEISPVSSQKELEHLLLKELRIDREILFSLNIIIIEQLAELYRVNNLYILVKYLRRKNK